MPKEPAWRNYESAVINAISKGSYENGVGIIVDPLPHPNDVRHVMEEKFKVYSNRKLRVILVEDFGDYKVFIQIIPNGKSKYDFYVWRASFKNGKLEDLKVPTHDELGKRYNELKKIKNKEIEEYLINAVIKLIHANYRWGIPKIISRYFSNLEEGLKREVEKFLATLKWIALQEDANYPPKEKKMGSKYTLAVYVLLEAGFSMSEIRRVIKFR
jgi:hypothetical protein